MNECSSEAYAVSLKKAPVQKQVILTEFEKYTTRGACGEKVTRDLFGPGFDKTGAARLAELKGVSLMPQNRKAKKPVKSKAKARKFSLVRTGERENTEQGNHADVLIHIKFATDAQIEAHKVWVKEERAKRLADNLAWIEEARRAPDAVPDLKARNQA